MSNEKGDHEPDQTSIKAERSQEKSSVTGLITRLTKLIHDRREQTQICEILWKIGSQIKGANSCNRKLYTLVSSNEFDSVVKWFIEVAEKADAIAKALTHLEEHEDEPPLSWDR
ncbi:Hypothetical predicted protein [Paramuricea clavata]|uniref:Uncharacterized protein n=1 Tax=Paramuricea clavata TaxID=317549 RepID=A0A7D9HK14_PARCT|nr:Hypothetical predicted protein [Paramuricea clavata]